MRAHFALGLARPIPEECAAQQTGTCPTVSIPIRRIDVGRACSNPPFASVERVVSLTAGRGLLSGRLISVPWFHRKTISLDLFSRTWKPSQVCVVGCASPYSMYTSRHYPSPTHSPRRCHVGHLSLS